jgi:tetratricopeptide (TPR) repeat protein
MWFKLSPELVMWFKLSPELIILIFGVLGVLTSLEHLPNVKTEGLIFKSLFLVGLLTQLLAHSLQYTYAITNASEAAKDSEAATAVALYAFTADDVPLLQATSKDSYLVGYRLFKDGQLEKSIPFFRQAIFEQKFIASSNFLLAQITTHDKDGKLDTTKDWTPAYDYLQRAIDNNPEYAPAYYLLASLHANSNRIDAALQSLPKAVLPLKFGRVGCQNINAPQIVALEWAPIRHNTEFERIQNQCKHIHGLD